MVYATLDSYFTNDGGVLPPWSLHSARRWEYALFAARHDKHYERSSIVRLNVIRCRNLPIYRRTARKSQRCLTASTNPGNIGTTMSDQQQKHRRKQAAILPWWACSTNPHINGLFGWSAEVTERPSALPWSPTLSADNTCATPSGFLLPATVEAESCKPLDLPNTAHKPDADTPRMPPAL